VRPAFVAVSQKQADSRLTAGASDDYISSTFCGEKPAATGA
jgi:hypothetical protein